MNPGLQKPPRWPEAVEAVRNIVEVWINSPHDGEPLKVTEGEFVFVAIDAEGRTRAISS